jgi:hypothetical protein
MNPTANFTEPTPPPESVPSGALVEALKLMTIVTLVTTLGLLANNRDFFTYSKEHVGSLYTTLLSKNKNTQTSQSSEKDSVSLEDEAGSPLSPVDDIRTSVPKDAVVPTQEPKKQVKVASDYEELNQGISDTDESYRPKVSPCVRPMGYSIKTFDTRFGISKEEFIKNIEQASSIWENSVSKDLFYYNENGPLTINLIYDERQAQTEVINNLAFEIENSKDTATHIKTIHEEEKRAYNEAGQQLTNDTEVYETRYKIYADKVAMYNAQGGAPQQEYDAMALELEQLKQEAKNLEVRRDELLKTMDLINAKVARYNELVIYINTLIKKSNSLGAAKFTEGRFVPRTNTVDIFQYNDSNKLLRVVTHELGHVLGINHNDNHYSIMYSFNSATTTTLSDEDEAELALLCNQ